MTSMETIIVKIVSLTSLHHRVSLTLMEVTVILRAVLDRINFRSSSGCLKMNRKTRFLMSRSSCMQLHQIWFFWKHILKNHK